MMITIHQRNWSFPTTTTLLANPPKFTSLSSARQIYHWPAHNSVNPEFACFTFPSPPFHESFTVWKVSFTGDKQFTNGKISNVNSQIQNPCVKYIPLLCRIWPGFKQKSSLLLPTKSWNDTNTCALIFLKSPLSLDFPWWRDQNYSSANYMHCSAKLSVTVHYFHNFTSTTFSACPVELSGWASDFFVEGRHLSKILLGANVTLLDILCLVEYPSVLK